MNEEILDVTASLQVHSPNKRFWKISPAVQAGIYAEINRKNKALFYLSVMEYRQNHPKMLIAAPCDVTITRLYNPSRKQKQWDIDNWIASCKPIRDMVADMIIPGLEPGQADSTSRGIHFYYDQDASQKKGVRIRIKKREL